MKLLDALVEQRIAAAAASGVRDDVRGFYGAREWDADLLVPREVRDAHRLLQKAGFAPPALEQLRSLRYLHDELGAVNPMAVCCPLHAEMLALDMALESLRGVPTAAPRDYCRRIAARLFERARAQEPL